MAETPTPHEPDNRPESGRDAHHVRLGTRRVLLAAAIVLALCIASLLAVSSRTPTSPDSTAPEGLGPSGASLSREPASVADSTADPAAASATGLPPGTYEEPALEGFEHRSKRIDVILLQALADRGLGLDAVDLLDVSRQESDGHLLLFQQIALKLPGEPAPFLDDVLVRMAEQVPEARLEPEQDTGAWLVRLDGVPTHRLTFEPPAPPVLAKPAPLPGQVPGPHSPQLALVIDDLGENLAFAKDLARLGQPITLAVWPHGSAARATAKLARKAGLEVIVHQPMQPASWPETDPGPSALLTTMGQDQVRQIMEQNLALIPGADGVNNHMGSAFTCDAQGMAGALAVLAEHNLFFLDSYTTPESVGAASAASAGVPFVRRDVFLDNIRDHEAILMQLRKAESLALSRGHAVAIGHPYPETLAALRTWLGQRDQRLVLVPVRDLAHRLPVQADAARP